MFIRRLFQPAGLHSLVPVAALFCGLVFGSVASVASGQGAIRTVEELDLSYVYAPIFGTGFYRAGSEQAVVLKVDANSWLLDQKQDAEWYWLAPVTVGVRHTDFSTIIDEALVDSLLNVAVMPGAARRYQVQDN